MKKYLVFLLAAIMLLTLAACTSKKPANEDNIVVENPKDGEEDTDNNDVVDPSPKTESKEVTLYFANKKYVEIGDENLEKLITEKRLIEYGDISIEESIVRELMKGPENTEELSSPFPATAKLLGVEVADGTAFVNFASEGMYGGSLQEYFTIDQIVSSLIELDNIDRVQFLIDGKKAETLMGHFSIDEPFENQ